MKKTIGLAERLRYALVEPNYPDIGIEFNSDCIRLMVVTSDKNGLRIQHVDSERVPPGSIEITPFKPNIHSMEAVVEALRALWNRNKQRAPRVCLLIQDRSALMFHTTMEHPASNAVECLELLRFKLKKNVPFRMEDAQILYFTAEGIANPTAANMWVLVMNHSVLHQYEQFVQSAISAECGLVDISTLSFMNLAHSEIRSRNLFDQDILYINLNQDYISLSITQKSLLTSFRTRPLEKEISAIDAAMEEIHLTTMYYQDKLEGQGFATAFVYSTDGNDDLCTRIESSIGAPAMEMPLASFAGSRFDPSNPGLLKGFSPMAGMLLSRKVEFV